jgi:RNA polymerase-binding transcription factor DksA
MTAPRLTRTQLHELASELDLERARLERSLAAAPELADALIASTGAPGAVHTLAHLDVASRTRARYDAILAAQDRIAAGRYGDCVACGDPIPFGRLIVMPDASHCRTCPPGS